MPNEYLKTARYKLMERYRFKFDAYGISPVYQSTLNAYLKDPRPFHDVGIRLAGKKIRDKKIPALGYFELFTPSLGAKPIAKANRKDDN